MFPAPFAVLAPLAIGVASAQEQTCPELHAADLTALNDQVDQLYVDQQIPAARRTLFSAEKRLPCVLEVVKADDLARFALRYAYALAGDPEAERWAILARALDPSIPFPSYVPNGHPVRDLAAAGAPSAVLVEGKGFDVPTGGGVFLDGRFLASPKAEPGVPHLLQVGDSVGKLQSVWMDGTAFPEDLLEDGGAPGTLPKWYSPDGTAIKVRRMREPWSDGRKANVERAFGFAAAGGALFGSAVVARGAYDVRPTDALFVATDGATAASVAAGATSLVFLSAALFGK